MGAYFEKPLSQLTSKWRIYHEESADLNPRDERTDFEELRGRGDTRIYRHGQTELAVSTEVTRTYDRLASIPGLRPKNGCVLLFDDEMLDVVAGAVRAKHRRQYTPEQLATQQERMLRARQLLSKPETQKPPKTDAN